MKIIENTIIFLIYFITIIQAANPAILAHLENGSSFEILQTETDTIDNKAIYYTVGTGKMELVLWSPFGERGKGGDNFAGVILRAMRELVIQERGVDGQDTISFKLELVGWDTIAKVDICKDDASQCPTIVIIGTTQFSTRVQNGDAINLDNYFDAYINERQEPFTDKFIKQVNYDYTIDGHYIAVPLVMDIRLVYYNRTTFDTLGLKHPPPVDKSWEESSPYYEKWNWKKFVEYVQIIDEADLGGNAFDFHGLHDEEMKLMSMIIRNYNIPTVSVNNTCGYKSNIENFKQALNEVVIPLFESMDSDWCQVQNTNSNVQDWIHSDSLYPALDIPPITCETTLKHESIIGMTIESPNSMNQVKLYSKDHPENEIASAYIPGSTSFLGGSGMMISKHASPEEQRLAWKFILLLTDINKNNYMSNIGEATMMFPPYEELLDRSPWNGETWQLHQNQIRHSVPIQYPRQTFAEFGKMEFRHPVRTFLYELIKKEVDVDLAIDRTCEIIDDILAQECTKDDWTEVVDSCNGDINRVVTFHKNTNCHNGYIPPKDITVECSYVPYISNVGILVLGLSIIGILISVIFASLIYSYKEIDPIRKTSYRFSVIIMLGTIFIYFSVFFSVGPPSSIQSILSHWLLNLGLGLSFGGLVVKAYRIYKIFNNHDLKPKVITDNQLLKMLGFIMTCELLSIIIWTITNKAAVVAETRNENIDGFKTITYTNNVYATTNSPISIVSIYSVNSVLLAYGCYLALKTWNIPEIYSEAKFIAISLSVSTFCAVICVPVLLSMKVAKLSLLLKSLTICFATYLCTFVFCIPKITSVIQYKKIRKNNRKMQMQCHCHEDSDNNFVNIKKKSVNDSIKYSGMNLNLMRNINKYINDEAEGEEEEDNVEVAVEVDGEGRRRRRGEEEEGRGGEGERNREERNGRGAMRDGVEYKKGKRREYGEKEITGKRRRRIWKGIKEECKRKKTSLKKNFPSPSHHTTGAGAGGDGERGGKSKNLGLFYPMQNTMNRNSPKGLHGGGGGGGSGGEVFGFDPQASPNDPQTNNLHLPYNTNNLMPNYGSAVLSEENDINKINLNEDTEDYDEEDERNYQNILGKEIFQSGFSTRLSTRLSTQLRYFGNETMQSNSAPITEIIQCPKCGTNFEKRCKYY